MTADTKMQLFHQTLNGLAVEPLLISQVHAMLCGSKKVIVIDNSASMNQAITGDTHLNPDHFGGVVRRIDELRDFLRMAVPILAVDSPGGVDVFWLNPPDQASKADVYWRTGVETYEDIAVELAFPPHSGTPLAKILQIVINKYCNTPDIKMHCIVCLDGEPDPVNGSREAAQRACRDLILARPSPARNVINFKVCTDKDDEIRWINKMDITPGIDISDDYKTEQREVLRAGHVRTFSYADYIVKSCIGAASERIDNLDEPTFWRRVRLMLMCK